MSEGAHYAARLYRRAIEAWGEAAQIDMAIEEASELILALQHLKRGRITALTVAREIADVEIMMGQLRQVFGAEDVDVARREKLERLEQRVAKAEAEVEAQP